MTPASKAGQRGRRGLGLALGLALALGGAGLTSGCIGLRPGGSQSSNDEYTYVSTPWEPLTVTLYDRRDDTPLWTIDVPVGQKVSVRFYKDKETSGSNRMPDIMRWEIFDQKKSLRRLSNAMAVPGADSRLLKVSLREDVPLYPADEPTDGEAGSEGGDRDWAPVRPRTFRGVPTGQTGGNYYRED